MAAVSPIPKIVTTAIKEDWSRDEEDARDGWGKPPPSTQRLLNCDVSKGSGLERFLGFICVF